MSSQNYIPALTFQASEVQDNPPQPKRGNLPLAESWTSADSPVQKKLSGISNELAVHKGTGLTLIVGYEKLLL